MNIFALIIPLLFLITFVFAHLRKVKVYNAFTEGVQGAIPLIVDIFPYITVIFMLTELFEQSGISAYVCNFFSPAFEWLGVPKEIIKLVSNMEQIMIGKKSIIDIFTVLIFIAVTVLSFFTDLSPVVFVITAAVCGLVIKLSKEKKAKEDDK